MQFLFDITAPSWCQKVALSTPTGRLRRPCDGKAPFCDGYVRLLLYPSDKYDGIAVSVRWREAFPGGEHATLEGWLHSEVTLRSEGKGEDDVIPDGTDYITAP